MSFFTVYRHNFHYRVGYILNNFINHKHVSSESIQGFWAAAAACHHMVLTGFHSGKLLCRRSDKLTERHIIAI